ncbi:MAG: hypothetical protein KBF93_21350 [Leptospiraceae bacterium]|nr:hypothetical protein [Leptospiraceae bacterium]
MESNSEEIKSNHGFRLLTKEEIEALSKEELDQYLTWFKEQSKQTIIRLKQLIKESDDELNKL